MYNNFLLTIKVPFNFLIDEDVLKMQHIIANPSFYAHHIGKAEALNKISFLIDFARDVLNANIGTRRGGSARRVAGFTLFTL